MLGREVLDTFQNTYHIESHFYDEQRSTSFTIPITLTAAQMVTVWQSMVDIDFFSFPKAFRVPLPVGENGIVTVVEDLNITRYYQIKARNGENTHAVAWHREFLKPTSPESERLEQLIHVIEIIIRDHPSIKQLPEHIICE